MKKLKVGIVGQRGLSSILGFKLDERVEVTALCEINEDVLMQKAKEHGIPKTYRVYEDMLDSDLDIIVVATPMQMHLQHVTAALYSGRHVLSEVTAGVTIDELWWLVEAVEATKKTYMMAENYLYIPEVQLIENMVKLGMFGETYFGEGEYIHNLEAYTNAASNKNMWRKFWQVGKRGLFYPTHSLGPVMKWLGSDKITNVACFGTTNHTSKAYRQDDTTLTICNTQHNKLIKIRLDCMSRRPHNLTYYSLQGTKGCYEAPRGLGDDHKIWVQGEGEYSDDAQFTNLKDYYEYLPQRYKDATEEQKSAGHWGGDFFIISDFLSAVFNGDKPYVDVYDACEWTAVGLLSELSVMNGGRTIDMPNFRKYQDKSEQLLKL